MSVSKTTVIGIIPVLVIAAVLGVYLNFAISTSNSVTISTLIVPMSYPGSNSSTLGLSSSPQGVELRVRTNSTTLLVGQSLWINVSLINTLPTSNLVLTSSEDPLFRVVGFPIAIWGPCLYKEPVEFMVVKGNYSLSQLEDLSQNTSSPEIGCMEGGSVNRILFTPRSEVADLNGTFCTAECSPYELPSFSLTSNFTISGYWGYPLNQSEAQDVQTPPVGVDCGSCMTFNYPEVGPTPQAQFSAGQYTLVASDEWGQVVILYFSVAASTPSPTAFSPNCSTSYFNGTDVVSTLFLSQKTGSSINLCVRFYYYNSTSTTILSLRQLTIYSVIPSNGSLGNASSLFSISATISKFQIGGPQSENEGFAVNYTISATRSTPSATYEVRLSSGLYPNYVICGWGIYLDLQVGNTTNPTVGTSCHYVPSPMNNPGLVYTEIVGKTNSSA